MKYLIRVSSVTEFSNNPEKNEDDFKIWISLLIYQNLIAKKNAFGDSK